MTFANAAPSGNLAVTGEEAPNSDAKDHFVRLQDSHDINNDTIGTPITVESGSDTGILSDNMLAIDGRRGAVVSIGDLTELIFSK